MATFNSLAGRAFVLPNPEEYYPTVDEFLGRPSGQGKISASRKTLLAKVNTRASESVSVPVEFVGNFPVMANDRNTVAWSNACGSAF